MFLRLKEGSKRGAVLPLILVGTVVMSIIFLAFYQLSKASRHRVSWSYDRMVAKNIAESALAMSAAAIFQNNFENRWYKTTSAPNGKYGGFSGSCEGNYGGGAYKIVAEDIIIMDGQTVKSSEEADDLTYNRIDLFAEGSYGNYKVVAYQALALMPEEKVFKNGKSETHAQGAKGEGKSYEYR